MSTRRGVFVFMLLLALLGAAAVFAAFTLSHPTESVRDASYLVFDVPEELEEAEAPPGDYSVDWFHPNRPQLWKIVFGLRQAAKDDRIAGLVLHVGDIDWGWAKVQEVRDAVLEFRAQGKPIYASFLGGGEREYLLASAADVIGVPPLTTLQLDGLTASAMFLKGTLDKLDIKPNFTHVGAYKSGSESYTRNDMSTEARDALKKLVDDLYDGLIDSLATAREFPRDTMAALLDDGPYDAPTAWERGLIDTVLYESELDSLAIQEDDGDRPTITLNRYLDHARRPTGAKHIALVLASGVIDEGKSRSTVADGDVLGSETMAKVMQEIRERHSVKAMVLRVDSPGGSAEASDEIWNEVENVHAEKPVVVSMSDYAASGGYYMSSAASTILADPTTITGSIGVYGGKLNVLGLYHKLGLNVETVSRGQHAEMLSPFKDFTPDEARRFDESMQYVYDTFVQRVADGREMDEKDVERVAQGHVWSGLAASKRGLVDELGGLERAIEIAKQLANIPPSEPVTIDVYPKSEHNFLRRFIGELFANEWEDDALQRIPGLRAVIEAAQLPSGKPLTLLPYHIDIR
jgi:protease-4